MWSCRAIRPGICLLALGLLLPALSGCGAKSGTISGKVTYKGNPVGGGTVTFLDSKQRAASSPIGADGSYSIEKVAPGPVKIGVMPPPAPTKLPRGMTMDPSKMGASGAEKSPGPAVGPPVKIPKEYNDPEKSGLTFTVQTGQQEHNIELK